MSKRGSDQQLRRQPRDQHTSISTAQYVAPHRALVPHTGNLANPKHAMLTYSCLMQQTDKHHTALLAGIAHVQWQCAECHVIPVPVDSERAASCTMAAMCQCSGGDGTSWTTVTRPPNYDDSDV
jgi:hypothetical protein